MKEKQSSIDPLTAHSKIILYIANKPDTNGAELAENLGVSRRDITKLTKRLQEKGILGPTKLGRRILGVPTYSLNYDFILSVPLLGDFTVRQFVNCMNRLAAEAKNPQTGE